MTTRTRTIILRALDIVATTVSVVAVALIGAVVLWIIYAIFNPVPYTPPPPHGGCGIAAVGPNC